MTEFSSARFAGLFGMPLFTHTWEEGAETNPELRELILSHATSERGVIKSNDGGWHSETGKLEFCGDAGRRLIQYIYELADEATTRVLAEHRPPSLPKGWILDAWANVNRSGDFNSVHVHPGSTWSGTYYVDAGDPLDSERSTPLVLCDPCVARTTTF